MVTFLYLVRHCQSMGNVEDKFQGRFDSPVSPLGEKQLDLLSLRFRNVRLDGVYASPLQRTLRTGEAIARFHRLEVLPREDFIELDVGELDDLPQAELARVRPDIVRDWDVTPDLLSFPGGENMAQAYERCRKAVLDLAEENPGKTLAVATHGGVLRCIDACARFGSLEGMRQAGETYRVGNTGISLLKVEDGRLSWEFFNDVKHLPPEYVTKFVVGDREEKP